MDTQPKIPTLKDSQKPQVKVRGLQAGATLFDRLKQFKKKDLAFILAGLGTLFMAPLAEHFMMSPESADGTLQQGWSKDGGAKGMFDGSGSSPYEPGTTGLAPGSAIGGGSDIITPLNVRDPSSLVMGPGSTQQPPTNSVMPSTPPPTAPNTHSDSDLKDALAASAAGVGAAGRAAVRTLLPVPHIALGGSGLHGLGAVSGGGSSAVAGGGPISSQGLVTGRAANNGSLAGVRGGRNITGVSRGQTAGSGGQEEALRKAADAAAGQFGRSGSAVTDLNNAAATAIPTGGGSTGGLGAGGTGATDKAFGGDQSKDGKNVGESLAFLKEKAMQEAQIALWAKEQEAGDNKLELLKLRNSLAESITGKIGDAVGAKIGCVFNPSGDGCPSATSATSYNCLLNGQTTGDVSNVVANYQACTTDSSAKGPQGQKVWLCGPSSGAGGGQNICACSSSTPTPSLYTNCTTGGTPPTGGDTSGNTGVDGFPGNGISKDAMSAPSKDMGATCTRLQGYLGNFNSATPTAQAISSLLKAAGPVAAVRDAVDNANDKVPSSGDCSSTMLSGLTANQPTLMSQLDAIVGPSNGVLTKKGGTLDNMDALVPTKDPKDQRLTQIGTDVNGDSGAAAKITAFVKDANTVNSAWSTIQSNFVTAAAAVHVVPADLAKAGAGGGTYAGSDVKKLTDDVNAAVAGLKTAEGTTANTVVNLNAAQEQLAPQGDILQTSAGKQGTDGTVGLLVQQNAAIDQVIQKLPSAVATPKLTAPDLTPKGGSADISQLSQSLQSGVPQDVQGAATAVGACTAAAPCKDATAQTAVNKAGTSVSTAQSMQSAVDKAIRDAATSAANLLKLSNRTAVQTQ